MSVFATLQAEKRAEAFDPLHPKDPGLARLFGSVRRIAGVHVDPETALSSTAMYAGVRFISENMASVPLKLYRREGRGKDALRNDRRWWLLQTSPNPEQTAMEFREMTVGFVVTTGNGYAEIVEGNDGIAREFWPLVPWRVRLSRQNGRLTYWVRRPGDEIEVPLPPERILHFRGFSKNGVLGDDVIERMKGAIGVTLAADRSAETFFGQGAQPSGVLETPNALSDQAYERMKKAYKRMHGGVENWHRLMILEEGTKWQQLSTDPEKAQLIETRKFQVTEVARILNLPPHVLKDLERATFSNVEHAGQELVTYTFRPWAVRMEQVFEKRLLLPSERPTHIIRHNLDGFLRGDMKTRFESYATARQWGWMSANDVLEKEDDNPIGEQGDIYMAPINMLPADQFLTAGLPGPEGSTDLAERLGQEQTDLIARTEAFQRDIGTAAERFQRVGERMQRVGRKIEARQGRSVLIRKRTEAAWQPAFRQRLDGLVRRETNALRNALRKAGNGGGKQEFTLWAQEFYRDNGPYVARDVEPMLFSFASTIYELASEEVGAERDKRLASEEEEKLRRWIAGYAERFGQEQADASIGQIMALMDEFDDFEEAMAAIEERADEWDATRGTKVARWESVNLGSRVTVLAFAAAGIMRKIWWANRDACPLCSEMHGRTVSIQGAFLASGDRVDPDDEDTVPLEVNRNYAAPPLHGGCDCGVAPG